MPFITSTITSTVTSTVTDTATVTATTAAAISPSEGLKIAGLVVGGVFGLGLLGVAAVWLRRRYVSPDAGEREGEGESVCVHLLVPLFE